MSLQQASLEELEQVFLQNRVDSIAKTLFQTNPPTWFFPYQLFLSEVAIARSDVATATKHRHLYEKIFPQSTLGS